MQDTTSSIQPKNSSFISIGGAIVFAVIALFVYEIWTKSRIDDCIYQAYAAYNYQWDFKCKALGKSKKKAGIIKDCSLPGDIAQQLDDSLLKQKNFCVSYG